MTALGEANGARGRALFSQGQGWLITGLIYATLVTTVIYPLCLILYKAFALDEGMDLEKLNAILSAPQVATALTNTILISLIGTTFATIVGVTLAWLVARTNMPGKRILDPLNMIPFYLSSIVGALAWQVIAAPRAGILNTMLAPIFGGPVFNIYSLEGVAFVIAIFYAPFVYLFTLGSLQSMDSSLEEASRLSGASTLQTALRITLPLSAPAILSSIVLVFVLTLGTFGVPLVLGVPGRVQTLATLMYRFVSGYPTDYAAAALIGVVLVVFTVLLTGLQIYLLKGRRFTTVTGKGYRPQVIDLGKWRWAGFAFNVVFLVLVIAPMIALVLTSFQNIWTGWFRWERLTFDNYHKVLFIDAIARRGFMNSMIISSLGATVGVMFCLFLALVVHRSRLPGLHGVPALAMTPIAVPGVVLGVGFLLSVVGTPLYGTLWIIMVAYIVEFLPKGYRASESLVQAVSRELDESARISGATWSQSIVRILAPLMTPGLVSIWLLMFVTYTREVSSSMMLFVFGTETLAIALIQMMEYEPYGVSAAFGVLQSIFLLACVALIRFVSVAADRRKVKISEAVQH